MLQSTVENILGAYLECAIWSSCDDKGHPLDRNYSIKDIAPEEVAKALGDVVDFCRNAENYLSECEDLSLVGHDFWLTRNGHGAGFWDRPKVYGLENSIILTDLANKSNPSDLYIGDDSSLYFFP